MENGVMSIAEMRLRYYSYIYMGEVALDWQHEVVDEGESEKQEDQTRVAAEALLRDIEASYHASGIFGERIWSYNREQVLAWILSYAKKEHYDLEHLLDGQKDALLQHVTDQIMEEVKGEKKSN